MNNFVNDILSYDHDYLSNVYVLISDIAEMLILESTQT